MDKLELSYLTNVAIGQIQDKINEIIDCLNKLEEFQEILTNPNTPFHEMYKLLKEKL